MSKIEENNFEVKPDGSLEVFIGRDKTIILDSVTIDEPVVLEFDSRLQPEGKIVAGDPRSLIPVAAALAETEGSASQIVAELVKRGDVTNPSLEERLIRAINRRRNVRLP